VGHSQLTIENLELLAQCFADENGVKYMAVRFTQIILFPARSRRGAEGKKTGGGDRGSGDGRRNKKIG
jgi:hypothetical protein